IDGFTKVFWRDEPVSHLWLPVAVLLATAVLLFGIARRAARRWEYASARGRTQSAFLRRSLWSWYNSWYDAGRSDLSTTVSAKRRAVVLARRSLEVLWVVP